MKTYPNDTAHPVIHQNQDGTIQYDVNFGLTKREYFVAMAMQGMLSADTGFDRITMDYIAESAVMQADIIIEKLNETKL
jgi:hypothetical protein